MKHINIVIIDGVPNCEGVIRADQEQFGSSWREISGRKNIMELIKKVWIYDRQRDEKDYPVTINF